MRICLLTLLALGCADATLEAQGDAGTIEKSCPELGPTGVAEGFTPNTETGECDIPRIAPEDVEAPEEPFEEPTINRDQNDEERGFFLNQEGDGKYFVYINETLRVGVRAIHYGGDAAPGLRVGFELLEDEPTGAVLSARLAETNEFGVAHVEVTGGPRPSFFRLQMTAGDTAGLTYQVNVILPPEGRDPGDPNVDPPPGGPEVNCLGTQGRYSITNRYEPARFLGDGIFNALDIVHRALSEPGDLVGDLIRDRIDGIWGSILRAAVRPVVNYLYDFILQNYAPDWVRWMAILAEDITGVLTNLELLGTMELGAAGGDLCELSGVHRWETLNFIWRAGCPAGDDQCGRFPVPLNQLGIAASESPFDARLTRTLGPVADMQIDEHRLQLNLGVALIWFIESVILPNRLNVNSFGELLQLVLPCDAVGQLVADYVGGAIIGFAVAPFVEEACEAGMELAGNWLVRQLIDQLNVDTFPMAGECRLRDTDGDQLADRISDGRWTEGLEGDFEGERIP